MSKRIPMGTYTFSPSDKEFHQDESGDWGPFSYRLHETLFTRIFNRLSGRNGGFHIHGGYIEGTGGCIEFAYYFLDQKSLYEFDAMMQEYGKTIRLDVDYSVDWELDE